MVGPFDVSLKALLQAHPRDWAHFSGQPFEGDVELIDTDLSTVAAEADKVIRVPAPSAFLLQIELQSSRDESLPERVLLYNELLAYRHGLPVISVVILLRPAADGGFMTGTVERRVGDQPPYLEFRYRIVRIWQVPVDQVLQWGLGALPLAPLAAGAQSRLPEIFQKMDQRIQTEATDREIGELWSMTQILLGLRYRTEQFEHLMRGVQRMKESVTYQAILAEGRQEGRAEGRQEGRAEGRIEAAQRALLHVAVTRFAIEPAMAQAAIAQVRSFERLDELLQKALVAESWDEVFPSEP